MNEEETNQFVQTAQYQGTAVNPESGEQATLFLDAPSLMDAIMAASQTVMIKGPPWVLVSMIDVRTMREAMEVAAKAAGVGQEDERFVYTAEEKRRMH